MITTPPSRDARSQTLAHTLLHGGEGVKNKQKLQQKSVTGQARSRQVTRPLKKFS